MIGDMAQFEPLVSVVAKLIHPRFRRYVEMADVEQELRVWILAHTAEARELFDRDTLGSRLAGVARYFCQGQKAQVAP